MNFLNPLVLLGLLTASIPIILHLLNLRKLKRVEFSTLKFLKELQKKQIKRLKIKQILLLVLRTLLIIFAVFAFARPTIQSNLPLIGTFAKSSIAIILDNSFSMDLSDESGNRFNQAKNIVSNILDNLKDGDEATIIPLAENYSKDELNLTKNLAYLKDFLKQIKISSQQVNLKEKIQLANSILDKANNINREIFIITDAQENIFAQQELDTSKIKLKDVNIQFLNISANSKTEPVNLSVDSINLISRIFQKGKIIELEAIVKNHSTKFIDNLVISLFYNNQRVAQRTANLSSNEAKVVSISAPPQSYGTIDAFVEIESDALEYDNKRFFGAFIPEPPKIALIGNNSDKLFASIALKSANGSSEKIVSDFAVEQFNSIDLNNYDIIFILSKLSRDTDYKRLELYLRQGGKAVFFADQDESNNYQNFLAKIGLLNLIERNYGKELSANFSKVDKLHPLFEGVFKKISDKTELTETPVIYKAITNFSPIPIIEIAGGAFLSEISVDGGKALYFAVKPTLEWSTFPLTGLFPTLLNRSVYYLVGKNDINSNVINGTSATINIPQKYSNMSTFKITEPTGNTSITQAIPLPSGSIIKLDNLKFTGNYYVSTPEDEVISIISVNNDPSESNLKMLSKDEIFEKFNKILENPDKMLYIENIKNMQTTLERARTGTELWQLFLFLAILCAIGEMIVARYSKNEALPVTN